MNEPLILTKVTDKNVNTFKEVLIKYLKDMDIEQNKHIPIDSMKFAIPTTTNSYTKYINGRTGDTDSNIFMVFLGYESIGYVTATRGDVPDTMWLSEIYLVPVYRGKGYGKQVLKLFHTKIKDTYPSVKYVLLHVQTNNEKAIKTYEKSNYKQLAVTMYHKL